MIEFKYDTQLLIEGKNLNENEISEYFTKHFKGDCLLAVGDGHFHRHILYTTGVERQEGRGTERKGQRTIGRFPC